MVIHPDRRSIMGKSFSSDLRDRVAGLVGQGVSRRGTARHHRVSASFAVKLIARLRATGSIAPARQGRPPGTGRLQAHQAFLIAAVEAKPDITMPELAALLLSDRGIKANPASLSRLLCRAGFSYKKSADGAGMRTR